METDVPGTGTTGKRKRRSGAQRRWSTTETDLILNYMKDTILQNREVEKPTAHIYYEKMLTVLKIQDVTHVKLKAKVANMKSVYLKAVDWRSQTGEGILIADPNGGAQTVKDYLNKICPYFDNLDEIFGTRANVKPPHIHSSDNCGDEPYEVGYETIPGELIAELDVPTSPPALPSSSSARVEGFRKKLSVEPKSWTKGIHKGSLAALAEVQSKRIDNLNTKIQLEERRFDSENNWRQAQLQLEREKYESLASHREKELDFKKLEIETGSRLKILEMEKEERIAKYKIEQETKLQIELAKLKAQS